MSVALALLLGANARDMPSLWPLPTSSPHATMTLVKTVFLAAASSPRQWAPYVVEGKVPPK